MPIKNKIYGYLAAMLLTVASVLLCADSARAVTYNLVTGTVPVTMPDGRVVTMWGFGLEGGTITVPGPVLDVPNGQSLTVNLTNNLPVPVSIVSPSLGLGASPSPVMSGGRVSSFTNDAAAGGGSASYTFATRPGTFLYECGSDPSLTIPMGLYGAIRVAAATAGRAYDDPSTAFATETLLLFSEVDPTINDAVEAGTFGTPDYPSTVDYKPAYFLVNGQAYSAGMSVPYYAGTAGSNVLLRLLNAGSRTFMPMLQGVYVKEIAQDGYLMNYPMDRLAVILPAGKTKDVMAVFGANGTYPMYDRRNFVTNAGAYPGGAIAFLGVGATAQPYNLSVTAAPGSEGVFQPVTASWGHPQGADQIVRTYLQVGNVITGGLTRLYYNNQTNLLYLLNDAGTAWIGGFAAGSANIISNSKISLDCANTTVTPNGNILTVDFRIAPAPGFIGVKPLLMLATDLSGNNSAGNWQQLGTWEIGITVPYGVSATAVDGSTTAFQPVNVVWADQAGASDIRFAYLQVGTNITGGYTWMYYNNVTNMLYMRDDANTAWLGGFAPGSANVITNSKLSMNCAKTTVNKVGTDLMISFNLAPAAAFTGTKPLILYVTDKEGNHPPAWTTYGSWNIFTNVAPTVVSATAAAGTVNVAQQVDAVYNDGNGAADIQNAYLEIGSVISGGSTKVYYNHQTNRIYLVNDTNTAWLGGFAPGSANVIVNSSVSIDCATTTVNAVGNDLTVSVNVTPLAGFTGNKPLNMFVQDRALTGPPVWEKKGTWTIN